MQKRSRVLDFLRGIAILLVMLRHSDISSITTRMGWIGVDLFFVLSGFLVSGLLFDEYRKTGHVRPLRFLIRRGFKIYPLFYTVLLLHVAYYLWKGLPLTASNVLPEIFFYQNYQPGIIGISWSLAIEEHFYFLLCIAIMIMVSRKKENPLSLVPFCCIFLMIFCLALRVLVNYQYTPFDPYIHFFPTHLRIDSLAFGVLISWLYYFKPDALKRFVRQWRWVFMMIIPVFLVPVFFLSPEDPFILTVGFTLLSVGFGLLMISMKLYETYVDQLAGQWKLAWLYKLVAWTGLYSYSIYLVHLKAGPMLTNFLIESFVTQPSHIVVSLMMIIFNIICGYLLSLLIEQPFLRVREKIFPKIV